MVSGRPPLGTVFETPAQLDHDAAVGVEQRRSGVHTMSATRRAPRAFGWMPSA